MRRTVASALAAVAALVSVGARDAASAPPPFRLVSHWGTLTPDIRIVGEDGKAKQGRAAIPSIWCSAVAPGGKFALLRTESDASDLLVMALPEGRIIRGLPAPVGRQEGQSMSLSADGRWGLFSGENNEAVVWDTERPRQIGRLVGPHTARVTATAIAPDGRAALTGDERGGVALWSMPDRKLRHRYSVEYDAKAVAFSPDGKRGVAAGRQVVMFDVATGKELLTLYGHGPFDRVAFTPDGRRLVLASAYHNVMTVSDAQTGRLLQLRKEHPIPWEMVISPDGRSVLGEAQFLIHRWQLDDLGKVDELGDYGGNRATGIGLGAGGRMFFTAEEDGDLKLWDARTGKRLASRHRRAVTALAWTPDGGTLVAGASDGTVTFWSASGLRLRESTRHSNGVEGVAISADGKLAATAAGDVAIWPLPRGAARVLGGDEAIELAWAAFAADGKRLIVGGDTGEWSSADSAQPGKLPVKSCGGIWSSEGSSIPLDHGKALLVAVTSWSMHPHGGGDSDDRGATVARLDLATCKVVWSDGGPARTAIAVSRDDKLALVADRKGGLELISLADGAAIRPLHVGPTDDSADDDDDEDDDSGRGGGTTAIAFLADKDRAMTGDSAGGLTVWNLATGKAVGRMRDLRRRRSFATAIAARPGARTVAVGTNRGEILIFAP